MRRNAHLALLERDAGIIFPGAMDILPDGFGHDFGMACDAQPSLVTTGNSGIPSWLSTYVDPRVIDTLLSPNKAAEIYGEVKKGDWLTETIMYTMVEPTGQTSSYGDFNNGGVVGANPQFPQRQTFHYQTHIQYGEKEIARMGLARLDWVGKLNNAVAITMNKRQNKTYFFGVSGLALYGALNDAALSAPITPGTKVAGGTAWVQNGVVVATANEIYNDIQSLFIRVQQQMKGLIERTDPFTLAMSPQSEMAMTATNSFNVSVADLVAKSFPKLTVKTAIEFTTAGGELVQLFAESVEGQPVVTTAFTEKMRSHAMVVETSGWKQKKSQGTAGTTWFLPIACSQMLGV